VDESLSRWADVDVAALRHNAELIRAQLRPETQLMVMVKSNGYGHGAVLAADAALSAGASWLGVFTAQEALTLRDQGFDTPVLVVGRVEPAALPALLKRRVDVSLVDLNDLDPLLDAAAAAGAPSRVHVKIDTGLGRLGVRPEHVAQLVHRLRDGRDHLDVRGVFTHFADADGESTAFTTEQHQRFLDAVDQLRPVTPDALLHCAGSAAILRMPETHHDLVRLGIAFYGYAPASTPTPALRIGMSVYARVMQVKTVRAGDTVGYGRTWAAHQDRRIATVAMGYGQGVRIDLSNRGRVVAGGSLCPIVGRVSMDQFTVDVSEADGVDAGDAAMLFGDDGHSRLGADEIAAFIGTIPHEILCAVSPLIERLRVDGRSATVEP